MNGHDIPVDEVARMANGQAPSAEYLAALAHSEAKEAGLDPEIKGSTLSADEAKARLVELSAKQEWAAKALTRGTAEARESIALNAAVTGNQLSDVQIERLAAGLSSEPGPQT